MNSTIPELSKFNSKENITQPSNKLSALWIKIEKHQKRNINFSKKKVELFDAFKLAALPFEIRQAEQIARQVEHITGFISRKSLTEMQRNELLDWILSDIDYLDLHPFAANIDTSRLRQQLNSELSQLTKKNEHPIDDEAIVQLQSMLDDLFDGDIPLERDELIDILKNPESIEKYIKKAHENREYKEKPFGDEQDQSEDSFEENYFHEEYEQHIGKHDTKVLEKLFKGSQLNKMYKRLAAKLHPDKENDVDNKARMHALMQQLVSARKNKDVFTMLTLYHDHIDDDSFNFDAETITAIESLLEQKVSELNYELRQLKSDNTIECIVWNLFKGRSNKITTQNIQNHMTQLTEEADNINYFILKTKTVKILQV
ncbi:MAG: hypothetical protein ACJA0H_001107, partial [Francisellaceae bacterium]